MTMIRKARQPMSRFPSADRHRWLPSRIYRMDEHHSNAFAVWKAMGAPQSMSGADYERLEAAGQLARLDDAVSVDRSGDGMKLRLVLPRQGVSLLRLVA